MLGWVICKVKDDRDDVSSQSVFGHIESLVYGALSGDAFPPPNGWVFLAKEKSVSVVAQNLSEEAVTAAIVNPIQLEHNRIHNDSLHRHLANEREFIPSYVVKNSPVAELNGTYLERGRSCDAPKYEHVRGWTIMRCLLPEIEELGISASDTYNVADRNQSRLEQFYHKADKANNEIISNTISISDGSSQFTRAFTDIARAGNRLISADQTLSALDTHARRGALRERQSSALLLSLTQNAISEHHANETVHAEFDSSVKFQRQSSQTSSVMSQSSSSQTLRSQNDIDKLSRFLETELVVTKAMTFQQSQLPSIMRSSDSKSSAQLSQDNNIAQREITLAEAELSAEVIASIEEREEALKLVLDCTRRLQNVYLEEGISAAAHSFVREDTSDALKQLRGASIGVCEAYGSWARVSARERERHAKKQEKEAREAARVAGEGTERSYCVVLAQLGTGILFGPSPAVQASVKKFSRGREEAKKPQELHYLGVFPTKETAVEALTVALRALPLEQKFPDDAERERTGISSVLCALRHCKKHYLVRNSAVDAHIPCEQCESELKHREKERSNEPLYSKKLPPFIYCGEDYLAKMWSDIELIWAQKEIVPMLFPDICESSNPLLLDESSRFDLLDNILRASRKKDKMLSSSTGLPPGNELAALKDPLSSLKGRRELLHDALTFSRGYIAQKRKEKALAKYKDHPWQPHRTADHLPALSATLKEEHLTKTREKQMNTLFLSASTNNISLSRSELGLADHQEISKERLIRAQRILSQSQPVVPAANDIPSSSGLPPAASREFDSKMLRETTQAPMQWSQSAPATSSSTRPISAQRTTLHTSSTESPHSSSQLRWAEAYDFEALYALLKPPKEVVQPLQRDYLRWPKSIPDLTVSLAIPLHSLRGDDEDYQCLTKGRAARAFDSREEKEAEGQRRLAFRRRLQQMIRCAVQIRYEHCNIQNTQRLLEIAKDTKSAALALDITQAELFIKNYYSCIFWSVHAQRVFRGNKAREMVRKILLDRETAIIRKYVRRRVASELARSFIPPMTASVLQRVVDQQRKKSLFSFALNISGFTALVRVFQSVKPLRKPNQLCGACQHKLQKTRALSVETSEWNEQQSDKRELSHKLMRDIQRERARSARQASSEATCKSTEPRLVEQHHHFYNNDPIQCRREHIYEDHFFCYCDNRVEEEHCLVRFFLPQLALSFSKEYPLRILCNMAMTTDNERAQVGTIDSMRSLLVGNLNEMEPLFPGLQDNSAETVPRSAAFALLQSSREHAVLPRLPPPLRASVVQNICGPLPLCLSTRHAFTSIGATADRTLTSVCDTETESLRIMSWQPMTTITLGSQSLSRLHARIADEISGLQRAQREKCRAMQCLQERECDWEMAQMAAEDIRSRCSALIEELIVVQLRQREIFNFERALFEDVRSLEQQERHEFTRSYDHFEDGNVWQELHVLQKLRKDADQSRNELTQVETIAKQAMIARDEAKRLKDDAATRIERQEALVADLQDERIRLSSVLSQTRKDLYETVRLSLHSLSYIAKQSLGGKRDLHRVPMSLIFIRDDRHRLNEKFRELCDCLVVKAMRIRSTGSEINSCAMSVVASVMRDGKSGYILVTLRALDCDFLCVEESAQHVDIGIEEHLFHSARELNAGNAGEIALTKDEVDYVLQHSVDYSHSVIQQTPSNSITRATYKISELCRTRPASSFVIPSKRPRAIDHVRVVDGEQLNRPQGCLSHRRKIQEQEMKRSASLLLQHLRMNSSTQRPCLGLLHFSRRAKFTLQQLKKCMWFHDVLSSNPLVLKHLVFDHLITYHTKERLRVVIHEHVYKWEVDLISQRMSATIPFVNRVTIDVQHILRQVMRLNKPLLMISALAQLSSGTLSPYFAGLVVEQIRTSMPGRDSQRIWFSSEDPIMAYSSQPESLYRTAFIARRVVCGRFVRVALAINSKGDWQLRISRADDWETIQTEATTVGNYEHQAESQREKDFWLHGYRGSPFVISLSRSEVLHLALGIIGQEQVPPGAYLSLLHAHHLHLLCDRILNKLEYVKALAEDEIAQSISLFPTACNTSLPPNQPATETVRVLGLGSFDPLLSANEAVEVDLKAVKKHVALSASRFNHFMRSRHPLSALSLSKSDIQQLTASCFSYDPLPRWRFAEDLNIVVSKAATTETIRDVDNNKMPLTNSISLDANVERWNAWRNRTKSQRMEWLQSGYCDSAGNDLAKPLLVYKSLWGFSLFANPESDANQQDMADASYYRTELFSTVDSKYLMLSMDSAVSSNDDNDSNEELQKETERLLLIGERNEMIREDEFSRRGQLLYRRLELRMAVAQECESQKLGSYSRRWKAKDGIYALQNTQQVERQRAKATDDCFQDVAQKMAHYLEQQLRSISVAHSREEDALTINIVGERSIQLRMQCQYCDVPNPSQSAAGASNRFYVVAEGADSYRAGSQFARTSLVFMKNDKNCRFDMCITRLFDLNGKHFVATRITIENSFQAVIHCVDIDQSTNHSFIINWVVSSDSIANHDSQSHSFAQAMSRCDFEIDGESSMAVDVCELIKRQLFPTSKKHPHSTRLISSRTNTTIGEELDISWCISDTLMRCLRPKSIVSTTMFSLKKAPQEGFVSEAMKEVTLGVSRRLTANANNSLFKSGRDICSQQEGGLMSRQVTRLLFVPFNELLPHAEHVVPFEKTQTTIQQIMQSHYNRLRENRLREKATEALDCLSLAESIETEATDPTVDEMIFSRESDRDIPMSRELYPAAMVYSPVAERRQNNNRVVKLFTALQKHSLSTIAENISLLFQDDGSFCSDENDSQSKWSQMESLATKESLSSAAGSMISCRGDAILMVRGTERDFQIMSTIFNEYHRHLIPHLEAERQRAGRERSFRRDNHERYRRCLLALSFLWMDKMDALFNHTHFNTFSAYLTDTSCAERYALDPFPSSHHHHHHHEPAHKGRPHTLSLHQDHSGFPLMDNDLLALLFRYHDDVFLGDMTTTRSNIPTPRFEFQLPFLIDIDEMRAKETERLFSSPLPAGCSSLSSFATRVHSVLHKLLRKQGISNKRHTRTQSESLMVDNALPQFFSPFHFLYSSYQVHCHLCTRAPSYCQFPHCGRIRLLAREFSADSFDEVKHSGRHAIDRAVRQVLCCTRLLSSSNRVRLRVDLMTLVDVETAEEDAHNERRADVDSQRKFDSDTALRVHWKRSQKEIVDCELLQELLISPEQKASRWSARELIQASGGVLQLQREEEMKQLLERVRLGDSQSVPFIKVRAKEEVAYMVHCDSVQSRSDLAWDCTRHEDANMSKSQPVTGRIRCDILRQMIDSQLSLYPNKSDRTRIDGEIRRRCEHENKRDFALPRIFFESIMHRLRVVSKNNRQSNGRFQLSNSTNKISLPTTDSVLSFDRELGEAVIRLRDNSVCIMYVLFGCPPVRSELQLAQESGVPIGALRFVSLDRLEELETGWTIAVYDVVSHQTRAVSWLPADITCFAKRVGETNPRSLVNMLLKNASLYITVTRIANQFVSLSANPLNVTLAASFATAEVTHTPNSKQGAQPISRKYVMIQPSMVNLQAKLGAVLAGSSVSLH